LVGSISSPRVRALLALSPLAIALGLGFDDNLGFDSIEFSRDEL
jgi:hypothetical protein